MVTFSPSCENIYFNDKYFPITLGLNRYSYQCKYNHVKHCSVQRFGSDFQALRRCLRSLVLK